MSSETAGSRPGSMARRVLVGRSGHERAIVWSLVGALVVWYLFPVAIEFGVEPQWLLPAIATVVTLGGIGYAYAHGGFLFVVILIFGPLFAGFAHAVTPQFVFLFGNAVEAAGVALAAATALAASAHVLALVARRLARVRSGE